jgi:hypothetical protein
MTRLHPDPAVAAEHNVHVVRGERAKVLLQALDEHRRHAYQLTARQATILCATRVQSNAAVAEKRLHFSLHAAATAKHARAGVAARDNAGPAVILSYMLSAFASFLAALCYTEFAVEARRGMAPWPPTPCSVIVA